MVKVITRSGIELVEGVLDRLRHAADHPEREIAVDTAQHAAAQDDIGASLLAKPRERDGGRIAPVHKAVEIVDQRTVALAAQIAQHDCVGKINARRQDISTTASCCEW